MQQKITNCILQIIKKRGLTQSNLGKALGMSQTAVSNLFSGKSQLVMEDFLKISNYLGVSPSHIIDEALVHHSDTSLLSEDIQQIICSDDFIFNVFNRLKNPQTLPELLSQFSLSAHGIVSKAVNLLKDKKIVIEDQLGRLTLAQQLQGVMVFRYEREYIERLKNVFSFLREPLFDFFSEDTTQSEKEMFQKRNVDAFFLEPFTEEQIEEQVKFLRMFTTFMKHQRRMNNSAETQKVITRSIIISHRDFPNPPIAGEK